MQIDIEHGDGGEPVRGARQSPLGWSFWTGCHPHEFAILYGLLRAPRDAVLARTAGVLRPLRQVEIPRSLHSGGVLVYAVLPRLPDKLIVRAPGGNTVLTESLGALPHENTAVCEAEGGPTSDQTGPSLGVVPPDINTVIAGAMRIYGNEVNGDHATRDLAFIAAERCFSAS
ncbi:MAG: hypothetical protein ACYDA6_01940 [Solirubrobacteraceae bacterium]